jgi:hypothetical protein
MKPFFIVGCPRSGTTMLQQALNRHSQVVIPPETKFFFSFLGHTHRRQLWHIERLEADLRISLPRPAARVASTAEGRAYYEEMARRYVERLGHDGLTHFGEKTPEHTGHLPLIRRLFPEAKVVAISRDGRDVAASLSRMSWMSADVYVNFLVWLYYNRVLRAARERGCPNLYWVRYEDIVADPEAELGKVLDFLELPYESAVAEGSGNREGIPVREYGWKKRALGHISDNRVGTFRRELSADQVALLERLGTSTLCSLGYELTTDGSARLSPRFLLGLGLRMSHFVYRLPWQSVINELLSRASRAPADSAAGVSTVVPALI